MNQTPQTLSHYRLVEQIGEGGMGVVWKAEDTILNRTVAIKVLSGDAAQDEQRREMFLQEARLASSVSDARIVQVHELGHEKDLDFIVMEYVVGRPLDKILHGRPLPPDKVAALGEQVARGLSRAHKKGLLHRDLKPANILVTEDGEVKVVDFGLAILFEGERTSPGADDPTRPLPSSEAGGEGERAGTLSYMAPEQIRGEKLDARSDIFSLGVVLYEMATGQRPFLGARNADIAQEILRCRPTPPHDVAQKLPLDLDRIIRKALSPKRGDRYQTMEDLAIDLKRLGRELESGSSPSYEDLRGLERPNRQRVLTAFVGVIAAATVVYLGIIYFAGGGRTDPATLMVLPVEVLGQENDPEYVGRAFARALAIHLSQVESFKILSVPAQATLGEHKENLALAAAAGAGRVVTAVLNRDGGWSNLQVSVLDANDDSIVWGEQQQYEEQDLSRVAGLVADRLANGLGAVVKPGYRWPLELTGSDDMSAEPLLAEALALLGQSNRESAAGAVPFTADLVKRYPHEIDAHILHADALYGLWFFDRDPSLSGRLSDTLRLIQRADPKSPYSSYYTALVRGGRDSSEAAVQLFSKILARDDLAPTFRAHILSHRGSTKGSIEDIDGALMDLSQALEYDPVNSTFIRRMSFVLRRKGEFETSLARAQQAVSLAPTNAWSHQELGLALERLGRLEDAVIPYETACALASLQEPCALSAAALSSVGEDRKATLAARYAASLPDTAYGQYNLACHYALSGDKKAALDRLRRAVDMGVSTSSMRTEPQLENLHAEPEFEKLLNRVESRLVRE